MQDLRAMWVPRGRRLRAREVTSAASDAFAEVQRCRLLGFSVLYLLGDARLAEVATQRALHDAAGRLDELRHPERAAAWLRRHVVASTWGKRPLPEGRTTLEALGLSDATIAGLSCLRPLERAALIASVTERLDCRDVETIVGRTGTRLDRLLAEAQGKYAVGYTRAAETPALAAIQSRLDRYVSVAH